MAVIDNTTPTDQDWRDVLATTQGVKVLFHLMEQHGLKDEVEEYDPARLQRLLGQRDVAVYINRKLEDIAPERLLHILQEKLNGRHAE